MCVWHSNTRRGRHGPGTGRVGAIRSLARRRSVRAGAGVGSIVCAAVRQGTLGASVTCQVCAYVLVSLLLGCGLAVARPDCRVAACVVVSVFVVVAAELWSQLCRRQGANLSMCGCLAQGRRGCAQIGLRGRGDVLGRMLSAARCCWRSCCCRRRSHVSLQVVFVFVACVVRLLVLLLMACASPLVL